MAIPGLLPANLSQLFHLPKPPISSSPLASGPLQKKIFLSWQLPFAPSQKTPLRQCSSPLQKVFTCSPLSFPPILLSFRPISPPPCSPLERGQRNNKKIIIIIPPQKAPLLGWGSTLLYDFLYYSTSFVLIIIRDDNYINLIV